MGKEEGSGERCDLHSDPHRYDGRESPAALSEDRETDQVERKAADHSSDPQIASDTGW
jgi:hypothetical protein